MTGKNDDFIDGVYQAARTAGLQETVSSNASRSAAAEGIALIVAVCIYTATASMHLFQPLLDAHAFRQCQTAVTAEYLAQDLSPWRMFVYETPLLGAPWRIPMEFPLFQWIVALLHRATGAETDLAGRVTAMLFHLACLWPAWSITRPSLPGDSWDTLTPAHRGSTLATPVQDRPSS